ncbi:MAG: InlB B-repeat-containing protein [Oscillospiraceae bacterium]|nr:InlB B-repeat-containing protein [Oscillospiraceae bacterium]
MKKQFKKLLSILMVFCMVMGMVPVQAFSEGQTYVLTVSAEPAEAGTVYIETPGVTEVNADVEAVHYLYVKVNEGYKFTGWYKNDSYVGGNANVAFLAYTHADNPSSDNYVAKFEKITYIVTFDSDGGSAVEAQTINEGNKVTKPADPTKEGYTFKGWFNGENEYNFDTAVTAPITLKAKWEENAPATYTVTFDSDGGSAVEAQTINEGNKATKPADPTKEGYTFKGWFNGETEYDFDTAVTAPITLKAKWEVTKYDVWVAGKQVTSANAADVLGDGAASYNPTTNTLTVSKNIAATGTTQHAIYAKTTDAFNVNVADGVTLSAADGSGIYVDYGSVNLTADGDVTIDAGAYGIYGYEDITIDCADLTITSDLYAGIYAGDGSVDLTAGNVTISAVNDSGIVAYDSAKLTVDGDVTIDAAVYGIYGYEDVTIDCADLTITGVNYGIDADYGTANLTAKDVSIEADDFAIYGYEDVTIDCADLTITSSNFGIYADFGDVGLKAEDVTIEAVVAIYGCENVTVDCGKFDAIADDGIYADGSVNLKAGDVAIEAVDYAIYGCEDVIIDCDTLNVISGSYGIYVYGGSIIIKNGTFDIQSTDASEDEADYYALHFTDGVQFPAGATVTAATEPNGTFVPYVETDNATYDHVKIGTVPAPVQPTVALNKSAITLTVDGTETLVPTITPADLPNYALSWTSDDESVATVDVDGTVTAVAPGTATITVTLMPGAMPRSEEDPILPTATCVVTVVEADVPQEPTTSVTVTKEWNVPETFDRADLPESVRVAIYANGEKLLENVLSERNEWTWTKELPAATEDGMPIVYTVDELEVPDGYEKTIGEAVETDTGIEITITNTLVEEDDKENEEGGNGGATTPTTPSAPSTPSVPDTGDNTNTLGWMTTMAASAAALIALVIYRRKRRAE